MAIKTEASIARLGLLLAGLVSSPLAQACGYTGGGGIESLLSPDGLIDIAILALLLGAAYAAAPELLQRLGLRRRG
ncbi:exported protein of unknown function [Sterolibacterium denitrificans]|uniref:Uncharacterized protein n=2 Tax=Sterolibacterium denitrificans TaxID=157592 RepID=A0A656Z845_9PROT|nr:hypothetical protein [Sterolibacterium denitrificans]KYC29142.1 hypothetical protein ACY05_00775 [Sterolibacterium denitrificans]SMB29228.1 exported protein of unknown function [Sterolibacterium denitrificans]